MSLTGDEIICRAVAFGVPGASWEKVGDLVRCKDCSSGELVVLPRDVMAIRCPCTNSYHPTDGYCHLGERRDDSHE